MGGMKIAGEGLLIDTSGNATLFGALQGNINGAYRDVEAAALYTLDNYGTNVHSFMYTGETVPDVNCSMFAIMIGNNAQFALFNVYTSEAVILLYATSGITATLDLAGKVNIGLSTSGGHFVVQNYSGAAIRYALVGNVGEPA